MSDKYKIRDIEKPSLSEECAMMRLREVSKTPDPVQIAANSDQYKYVFNDYNGDGFTDYVKYINHKAELYLNNKNGGFHKTWELTLSNESFDLQNSVQCDFNGDGKADLIPLFRNTNGYYASIYTSTGDGFTLSSQNITVSQLTETGDVNGDGKAEFIVYKKENNKKYCIINGESYPLSDSTWTHMSLIDFNGDGKSDIFITTSDSKYKIYEYSGKSLNCLYSTTLPMNYWGDFNGDGKLDYLTSSSDGRYEVNYSNDNGFVASGIKVGTPLSGDGSEINKIYTGDINGDGITDVFEIHLKDFSTYTSETGTVYLMGSRSVTSYLVYSDEPSYTSDNCDKTFATYDFDGDGSNDIVLTDPNSGIINSYDLDLSPKNNMVASIVNGFNNKIQIDYLSLTHEDAFYTPSSSPSLFPLFNYEGALYAVHTITTPDGIGGNSVTTYSYGGALMHRQGKGFLGFSRVVTSGPLGTTVTSYGFNATYFAPYLSQIQTMSPDNGDVVSDMVYSYHYVPLPDKRYFSYPETITQTDRNGNTAVTNDVYDNDGNLTNRTVTVNDGESSVASTYNAPFVLNVPTSVSTTFSRSGKPDITQTSSNTFKSNGAVESSTVNGVSTTYDYNSYGNPVSVKLSASGMEDRTTLLDYEQPYNRFVTKKTNPFQQFTQTTYDNFGNVLSQTDINNTTSTNVYDTWGSLTRTTTPDGRVFTRSNGWANGGDAPENALYYMDAYKDNVFTDAEYFDASGRSLRKVSIGTTGIKFYTDTKYNASSQVIESDGPYKPDVGTTNSVTLYTYSDLRLQTQTLPDGVVITNSYSGNTVTQNYSTGEAYTKTTDGSGNVIEATDPGGSVTYDYNSINKPLTITSPGSTVTMTYDNYGHQLTLTDPNAGTTTYGYNAFGELNYQEEPAVNTNASSPKRTTTIIYDKLGRGSVKTVNGVATTYTYDQGTRALGTLTRASRGDTIISYTYSTEGLCRLITETRASAAESLTYGYSYDNKGRASTMTYPAGFSLNYTYNDYDDMTAIHHGSDLVWQMDAVNSKGQLQNATYGNNKQITYGYDTRDRLNHISVPGVLDFNYEFNDKQQLNFRNEKYDINGTLSGAGNEVFTYDGVNRLTNVKIGGADFQSITYNQDRIATKSAIGTYTYNTNNHQLGSISPTGYSPPPHNISYTAEGMIHILTETGEDNKKLTCEYGTDHQRFKTEYTKNGVRQYTRYYFDTYEKEVKADNSVRHLNYIYAPGGLVAIYEQKTSGDAMHYIYTDYLGSIRCVTDGSGNTEQRLSYDAWGNRRDPLTLVLYTSVPADLMFARGFTGHEHLDEFGLINMNGRVYDPMLGIFLSPDPYVQDPSNSQSYNRYAYCLNNPLMYTDPSGYSWWSHFTNWVGDNWKPITVAAVAIGVTVLTAGLAAPLAAGMGVEGAMGVAGLSGMAGGLVSGAGIAWAHGGSLGDCLGAGFMGMVMGGIGGAVSAGIMGGIMGGIGNIETTSSLGYMERLSTWRPDLLHSIFGASGNSIIAGLSNGSLASGIGGTLGGGLLAASAGGMPIGAYSSKVPSGKGKSQFITGYTISPEFPGVMIRKGEFWANLTGACRYEDGTIYLPEDIDPKYEYGIIQHEYGHFLQEQQLGKQIYHNMEMNSFLDMTYYKMGGNDRPGHANYWVETDANVRSANFFKQVRYNDIHSDIFFPKIPKYWHLYYQ
jgi:RHS repeat-associated protein